MNARPAGLVHHEQTAQPLAGVLRQAEAPVDFEDKRPLASAQSAMAAQIDRSPRMAAQSLSRRAILRQRPNRTGLPDALKAGVESMSGMSLDHVRVHYNSSQPAQLNAHAYAQGSQIHIAPGQTRHLPHEAWHIVQQAQGRVRPTLQMKGGVGINDDKSLEGEADLMGSKALEIGNSMLVQRTEISTAAPLASALHAKGCYCPGCCAPVSTSGAVYSLRSFTSFASSVVQRATTIAISDATGQQAVGSSGNQDQVIRRISRWPSIKRLFEQNVLSHNMPEMENGVATKKTYPRAWNFCAEPHAFANLLHRHEALGDGTVTNAWLAGLRFDALSVDDNGAQLRPCPVCAQWVSSGALPLRLRVSVLAVDPIRNEAQINEEREKTDFALNVGGLGAGQEVYFDSVGDTKAVLGDYLQYFNDLKRKQGKKLDIAKGGIDPDHGLAWAGVIHENSAPDFVAESVRLANVIGRDLQHEKVIRSGALKIMDADKRALDAMAEYLLLCRKKIGTVDDTPATPNRTLIANWVARADPQNIIGDVRNLDREQAMEEMPAVFDESAPADLVYTINDNGSLEILDAILNLEWPSE